MKVEARISASFVLALVAVTSTRPVHAGSATFSGRLAAVPCHNDGDIDLVLGEVRAGEQAKCAAEAGGTIAVYDTSVAKGGRLHLAAGGGAPWGKIDCDPAANGDCNRCANDVVSQFVALFDDYEEHVKSWSFDTNDYYLPAKKQPNDTLVDAHVKTHVQGFVRTNSKLRPYAGTYSWKSGSEPGSMFEVRDDNGDLSLTRLHTAWDNHPSGAAVLGGRMWFGDKITSDQPYVLRSIVIDDWFDTEQAFLPLPAAFVGDGPTMGGGVALAKLTSGGYLLVTMGPGGNENSPRTDFFFLIGQTNWANAPSALGTVNGSSQYDMQVIPLGRWKNSDANDGAVASQSQFQWSENISVVTECGSGDVYVINATGKDGGINLFGSGYYRLSRIDWGPLAAANLPVGVAAGTTGPKLSPIAVGWQDTNEHECWQRAAATAWVNEQHQIELYCSERKATWLEDRMHFVRRRPK